MTHPYASLEYAQAFGNGFEPIYLESAQMHVLKRNIPGTEYFDAMGCYPLSPLAETANLENDFAKLKNLGVVSLVLVSDPFFCPGLAVLQRSFDKAVLFKEHYQHDFSLPRDYSKHHRSKVKRAMPFCEVRVVSFSENKQAWEALYQNLINKHGIKGIQAFGDEYFTALSALDPIMIAAFSENRMVCAHLCLEYEGFAYSHLTASSEEGYDLNATYAVYDYTLRYFSERGAKQFDLGAGAGLTDSADGLTFFKKGFSNSTKPCYLCGKILDKKIYEQLSSGKNTEYFPIYRGL